MKKRTSWKRITSLQLSLFVLILLCCAFFSGLKLRFDEAPELDYPVREYAKSQSESCESLTVRTEIGMQSANLNTCKTPVTDVEAVCLPLCGAKPFSVNVSASAENDEVKTVRVKGCGPSMSDILFQRGRRVDKTRILVVFKMTRVFNGFHLYHVLNNFVVNLDPSMLDHFVFHCWGCEVTFSRFFDRVLNLNARMVHHGCYERFIFLGEHYTTYSLNSVDVDVEKRFRWRQWSKVFQQVWCPSQIEQFHKRYTTLVQRQNANNGRNMHHCKLSNTTSAREVTPTLENVEEVTDIICNSKSIISAEGNGLTNMILLQPSSVVTVLWQTNRDLTALKVIYGNMAKLLGLHMVCVPLGSDQFLNVNCSDEVNTMMKEIM